MFSKRMVLKFSKKLVEKPIICELVKKYEIDFSILKANVMPNEEGLLVLEFTSTEQNFNRAMEYLRSIGVNVQPLEKDIIHNEVKCTHCGVCVAICPSKALVVEPVTRKIKFYDAQCIACELCIKVCPLKAMEVHF